MRTFTHQEILAQQSKFGITYKQAKNSLLNKADSLEVCKDILMKNWDDIISGFDLVRILKENNFMGFVGQPIKLADARSLFEYIENVSDKVLKEYGWL